MWNSKQSSLQVPALASLSDGLRPGIISHIQPFSVKVASVFQHQKLELHPCGGSILWTGLPPKAEGSTSLPDHAEDRVSMHGFWRVKSPSDIASGVETMLRHVT